MKLLSLKLSGFRRFHDEVSIRLTEKLIALVGPNEAGKSSFLDALQCLGRNEPIPRKDTTRRQRVAAAIEACFEVEDSEREDLLNEVEGGREIRRLVLSVSSEADARIHLDPEPPGMLKLREEARLAFEECGFAQYVREGNSTEQETKRELINQCGTTLRLEDSYLDLDEIAHLKKVGERLRDFNARNPLGDQELDKFTELLEGLVSAEESNPPRKARDILIPQIPEFIFFDDAARELRNTYRLSEHGYDPPPPLRNFCGLAN